MPQAASLLSIPARPPVTNSPFRSDNVAELRNLVSLMPYLNAGAGTTLLRLVLVLDANVTQRELRWRVGRRLNPEARSSLHEVIDSSVVVPIAPAHLLVEIEEHIQDIANDCGVSKATVEAEWARLRTLIKFCRTEGGKLDHGCPDPDDLPYVALALEIDASAIYSSDRHFDTPSIPLLKASETLDLALRDYARNTALTIGVRVYGTFTIAVGLEAITSFVRWAIRLFSKLPAGVKLGIGMLVVAALVHPTTRKKLLEWARCGWEELTDPNSIVLPELFKLAEAYSVAEQRMLAAHSAIVGQVPKRRPATLLAITKRAFLTAQHPLQIEEIAGLVRREGYHSDSEHHRAYLKRLLRNSAFFKEIEPGVWTVSEPT